MDGDEFDKPASAPAYFTPQDLARALGVSTSTVKRWGDQGRFPVRRTEGGHRRIPREDALSFLHQRGVPVTDLIAPAETRSGNPSNGPDSHLPEGSEGAELLRLLTEGRELAVVERVMAARRSGRDLADILHHGLAPALRHIGWLWQTGRTGIYTEHLASRITARVLSAVCPPRPHEGGLPVALGGTPESDPHGLASAMAAAVIEEAGWRTLDLGAYCPAAMLAQQARNHGARLVWLALGSPVSPEVETARLEDLARRLAELPDPPLLVAGGPGSRERPHPPPAGVRRVASLPELAALAQSLNGQAQD
jgi:excisionase family DNA binding protein